MIDGGPVLDNTPNETPSLGEHILRSLRQSGDKPIIIDGITGKETKASELLESSIRIAAALTHLGYGQDDPIAICSENRIEACSVVIGTIFLGATSNPISSFFSEIELDHSVNLSKPRIIFVSSSALEKILKISKDNPFIKDIIVFGDQDHDSRLRSFNDFLKTSIECDVESFACKPQNTKDNVAVILASAGTSGLSKGVQLTQFNFLASFQLMPPMDMLTAGPLSYMSGFHLFIGAMSTGSTCYILSQIDNHTYFNSVQKYRLLVIVLNQSMMNFLIKDPLADQYDLSALKMVFLGGAAIAQSNYDVLQAKYPHVKIVRNYGSTETFVVTNNAKGDATPGSSGTVVPGVVVKIVDPDTGALLGPNQPGEIRVKGPRTTKGYVGDPKATSESFDKDGFYCSGDIAYYNEKEELFIVDRIKELIKYCGKQVYPCEMEKVLMSHQSVADACVIGLPDESVGELPLAFIVKKKDVSEKELVDYVADHLSSPQHLRGGVIFIPEMPQQRSGSGKAFRRHLKQLAVQMRTKM